MHLGHRRLIIKFLFFSIFSSSRYFQLIGTNSLFAGLSPTCSRTTVFALEKCFRETCYWVYAQWGNVYTVIQVYLRELSCQRTDVGSPGINIRKTLRTWILKRGLFSSADATRKRHHILADKLSFTLYLFCGDRSEGEDVGLFFPLCVCVLIYVRCDLL